jgi:hypothetical protein
MTIISWFLALVMGVVLASSVSAAHFSCSDGNVTCLIASINTANQRSGNNTILLGPGVYSLTAIDNTVNGNTTLPIIARNIKIRATSNTEPTIIENDTGAAINSSRIFFVANLGNLTLDGIILRNTLASTDLLRNLGTTAIQNSIITGIRIRSVGGTSALQNFGRLTISNTVIDFNQGEHGGGGAITNEPGGFASIEHSTIADNVNFLALLLIAGLSP